MIWGCLSSSGYGAVACTVRRIDSEKYTSILDTKLVRSMEATYLLGDMPPLGELIFLQDRNYKHISRATKSYLNSDQINYIERPAQSTYLNPIEHNWGELKRRLRLYQESLKV